MAIFSVDRTQSMTMFRWMRKSAPSPPPPSTSTAALTSALLLIVSLIGTPHRQVSACLPRTGSGAAGKPLFWNMLFGQRGNSPDADDETEPVYDEAIESRAEWNTVDWIAKNNYVLETHNVTTQDGYQLQLQRLPKPGHRPILLVHGLLTSSLAWVLMGPKKSLAFILFDKDYDVWLANLRGSTYGRNHSRLNATDPEFWSFSFHEQGAYDLPAIIERIRDESSFHQVMLVTHSQGFNAFLVLCTLQPAYNDKILLVQALAPTIELRTYVKFNSEDVRRLRKWLRGKLQSNSLEALPSNFVRGSCWKAKTSKRKECSKLMKTFAGSANWSKAITPLVYGQLLQGGSVKELFHLTQLWKSGDFVAYDYDTEINRQYYNTVEPLGYDLRRVKVPTVLHFGTTDALATPDGVHHIYSHVLHSVIGVYRATADKFNHLDFLLSDHIKALVNDKLIDIMEKYFAGTLKYIVE